MGSTKQKSTRSALPDKLGSGLDNVDAFILADDDEIRDAYLDDVRLTFQVIATAQEVIATVPVGSPRWVDWARKLDQLRDAVDIHDWSQARNARMFLLAAIEDAVTYQARKQQLSEPLKVFDSLAYRDERTLTKDERVQVNAAARAMAGLPLHHEKLFRELTGRVPEEDVTLFAAFLFRRRCPKFARGLVTAEGLTALRDAVTSWSRPSGRPKKGDTTLPKWDACDALMKAAGLVGTARESLKKDWEEWNARRNK